MTKEEWRDCTDPEKMLESVCDTVTDRKLRLFAVACCRRVSHLLNDEQGEYAIQVGEQCADGIHSVQEAYAIGQELNVFFNYDLVNSLSDEKQVDWNAVNLALLAAGLTTGWLDTKQTFSIARNVAGAVGSQKVANNFDGDDDAYEEATRPFINAEHASQAFILREILNPYGPATADGRWLTPSIVELADSIYAEQAFNRMPELTEALLKAECDNLDILTHRRQPSEHVRGCWVLDLLLGKK